MLTKIRMAIVGFRLMLDICSFPILPPASLSRSAKPLQMQRHRPQPSQLYQLQAHTESDGT